MVHFLITLQASLEGKSCRVRCHSPGQWGEWHTMWSHYPWPDKHAKHKVLAKLVSMYAETFKFRPVIISYCLDDDHQQVTSLEDFHYRQALGVAMERGFALARHGFIDGLWLWDRLRILPGRGK